MAIAFVQQTSSLSGNQSSIPLAFTANLGGGSLLVVVMDFDVTGATPTVSVTDSQGNVYKQAGVVQQYPSATQFQVVFYAYNAQSGPCTVTFAFTNTNAGSQRAYISEYSGASIQSDPLDAVFSTNGTGGTANAGPLVTAVANEMVIGIAYDSTGNPALVGGWNSRLATGVRVIGDQIAAGAATSLQNIATVTAATQWAAHILAFKPQVAVSSPDDYPNLRGTPKIFFQVGSPGGAQWKSNLGGLDCRIAGDGGYAPVRGATPVNSNDLATKGYVDGKLIAATVTTSESKNANTFGDLTTAGPSISVTPTSSGNVLIHMSAQMLNNSGSASVTGYLGLQIDGVNPNHTNPTTADKPVAWATMSPNFGGNASGVFLVSGLSVVAHTFKIVYACDVGTSVSFCYRTINGVAIS